MRVPAGAGAATTASQRTGEFVGWVGHCTPSSTRTARDPTLTSRLIGVQLASRTRPWEGANVETTSSVASLPRACM